MSLAPAIHFDAFRLDPEGRRLERDGEPVALEPKAFEVLALLAGSPGKAFTRDEILDAVWGHRHVTPGVLNRIMTLLRHALGEDAQRPRYLHTLHGVGYRFDLPPQAEAAELHDRRSSDAVGAPPRKSPSLVLIGLALVLLAVGAWWATRRAPAPGIASAPAVATPASSHPAPASVAAKVPTLIVMPLRPTGADAATRDIAAGLSDELITELSRISGLQVIAKESTLLATGEDASLDSLVRRLSVTHALEGSMSRNGQHLRVRVRLVDAATSRTLWTQEYDRDAADVLQLQRDVAAAVAGTMALRLGLASVPAKGGDAEHLRRYLVAHARISEPVMLRDRSRDDLEAEFRDLLRERPDDARSRAALAVVLENRASANPRDAESLRRAAQLEAAEALRQDAAQPDALSVQAADACRREQWEPCLSLLRQVMALDPSSTRTRFQYALQLAALGYVARSEQLMREGNALDPLSPSWSFGRARLLDTLGRHDEALAVIPKDHSLSPYSHWFNAVWRGDLATARAIAAGLGSNSSALDRYESTLKPSYVSVTEALADPNRWPEARRAMDHFERESGLMDFLRVLDPAGDPAKILDGLRKTRARSYSTWDLLIWTRDLPALRRAPAFQEYLRESGILEYWNVHGFPPQCRARAGGGADCD
jgi:TolB-like protein/DNA-binding winged helix-turn-helix (wHTH) protein